MNRQGVVWKFVFMICCLHFRICFCAVESTSSTDKPSDGVPRADVLPDMKGVEQSSNSPSAASQAQVRNRRNSFSDTEQYYDNYGHGPLNSAFKYNDQIMQNLLRTHSPNTLSNARSNFFYSILKPRTTRYNSWDDHSVMHFGKRSEDSLAAENSQQNLATLSKDHLSALGSHKSGKNSDSLGKAQIDFKEFPGDDAIRQSLDPINAYHLKDDKMENENSNKRSKDPWHSMMSFGKKSEDSFDSANLQLSKKDDSWHSMMNFGKKSDPWHSMMSFGKKSDPWHSMMSFGKKSAGDWDHSTLHFGKREDPWHNMMSFGKRSEGFWDHNTLHFGKKNEPWHSMMSFGKKSANPWDHSTLHFGKRDKPWHNMMSFGKRSVDPPSNGKEINFTSDDSSEQSGYADYNDFENPFGGSNESQGYQTSLSFDKKDDPWHNMMSFGKKSGDSWDSHGMIHFGKRDDPWHNMMSFGKKSEDTWDNHGMIHFGKREEPWHSMMSFGKRDDNPWDNHGMIHFGKRTEPWHSMMSFGKRFDNPWDNHGMIHFGKRGEPWHSMMSFGKKSDESVSESQETPLDKRQDPWHSMMSFGKKADDVWDNHGMIHFGKREEPWHSMMSFGKKSENSLNQQGDSQFIDLGNSEAGYEESELSNEKSLGVNQKRDNLSGGQKKFEPWSEHNTLHFGKRSEVFVDPKLSQEQVLEASNLRQIQKRSTDSWNNQNSMQFVNDKNSMEQEELTLPKGSANFDKRDPSWDLHNTLHFGKKFDPWDSHNTMHFGKKADPWDSHNTMHFGKKADPWDSHNTMHFGKKADPWDSHNTMHFGKKADPWDSHNTMHFSKKDFPWQSHGSMHFGKKSSMNTEGDVPEIEKQGEIIHEKEHLKQIQEDRKNKDPVMKRSVNTKDVSETKNKNLSNINKGFQLESSIKAHTSDKKEKNKTNSSKASASDKHSTNTTDKKLNLLTEKESYFKRHLNSINEVTDDHGFSATEKRAKSHIFEKKYANSQSSNENMSFKNVKRSHPYDGISTDDIPDAVLHFGKRSAPLNSYHSSESFEEYNKEPDKTEKNYYSRQFDKKGYPWENHSTMHFGKKSDGWEHGTLHFGKKFDPWESHNTMHFGKKSDWDHSVMHFGKKSDWDHNVMHFGKKSDWDHSVMHFGKRPDWDHSVMHFGKRNSYNSINSNEAEGLMDDSVPLYDLNKHEEEFENEVFPLQVNEEKLRGNLGGSYVPNVVKELLLEETLTLDEKLSILRNYYKLLLQRILDQKDGNYGNLFQNAGDNTDGNIQNNQILSLHDALRSLEDGYASGYSEVAEDGNKDLISKNRIDEQSLESYPIVKKGFLDRYENKRYWSPFQGPKSIVYPHAFFASQIRRSGLPRSRVIGVRMAEKKEDPVNSFMHFGRR